MGNALIKLEKGLYASQANDVTRAPFKVVDRKGDRRERRRADLRARR